MTAIPRRATRVYRFPGRATALCAGTATVEVMDRRWLLLGVALLFAALTAVFALRANWFQAAVAAVQATAAFGLTWHAMRRR